MKYRLQFTYTFNPLPYLEGGLRDDLTIQLAEQGSPTLFPGLQALQRRHQWALELPRGAFANDFTPGAVTVAADVAAREAFIAMLPVKQWHGTRDIFERDGIWYYRRPALDRIRKLITHNAIFEAAYQFIVAAEADRTLIKGAAAPRKPRLTPEERLARFGIYARGPGWTPEEDAVLKRWFGMRTYGEHAGHHARITEEQWGFVLEALGNLRTRTAVTQRICYLNEQLRKRFTMEGKIVDGYITSTAVDEYKQCALGEQPRIPPQRPRLGRRKDAPASPNVAKT